MKNIISIGLAIILLMCLLDLPYGYYRFVRIAAFVGFSALAYYEFEEKKNLTAVLFVACAILFNPIYVVFFTRHIWNTIDIIVAVCLLCWILSNRHYKTPTT